MCHGMTEQQKQFVWVLHCTFVTTYYLTASEFRSKVSKVPGRPRYYSNMRYGQLYEQSLISQGRNIHFYIWHHLEALAYKHHIRGFTVHLSAVKAK